MNYSGRRKKSQGWIDAHHTERRLTEVIPLKTPMVWIDGKPVPDRKISAFKVEWKKFVTQGAPDWMPVKKKPGKIHVWMKIGSNQLHAVLDDHMPIGIQIFRIDGQNVFIMGQNYIKDDGNVYMTINIEIGRKPARKRFTLHIHAFQIRWTDDRHRDHIGVEHEIVSGNGRV